jgi:hypothetical protein
MKNSQIIPEEAILLTGCGRGFFTGWASGPWVSAHTVWAT